MSENVNRRVMIKFGSLSTEAVLNESSTASAIWENLPMESIANLWGKEIYFETQVISPLADDATKDVKPGDIGYWPMGRAICIFFGPTPLSKGDEIIPAAPVNIVGKITGDMELLKEVEEREIVVITRIQNKEVQ